MGRAAFKTHPGKGQHFLVDETYVHRILDSAGLEPEDEVIEIGPGFGALTIPLSSRVSRILAIEWDKRLVAFLCGRLSPVSGRMRIMQADVMEVDFAMLLDECSLPPVIMGNLPYYLATALIQRLLPLGAGLKKMIFMVQKEVAERLTAQHSTKAYGYLTLLVAYFAEAASLLEIPPIAFKPKPQVSSAVVLLKPRHRPPVKVERDADLFRVVKSGFRHRRKTLINSLKLDPKLKGLDIEGVCRRLGLAERVRAEALSLEDFARLSNALFAA